MLAIRGTSRLDDVHDRRQPGRGRNRYVFGTNPATGLEGPRKGLRVLAVEEDLGRELIKSLTAEQQKAAIYDPAAPKEIITGKLAARAN